MKLTNIDVDLQSPIGVGVLQAGGADSGVRLRRPRLRHAEPRGRCARFTFFRIPASLEEQLDGDGSYNDFDIHAHLQHQQVRRRAARLAQDDDLLRGGPR